MNIDEIFALLWFAGGAYATYRVKLMTRQNGTDLPVNIALGVFLMGPVCLMFFVRK